MHVTIEHDDIAGFPWQHDEYFGMVAWNGTGVKVWKDFYLDPDSVENVGPVIKRLQSWFRNEWHYYVVTVEHCGFSDSVSLIAAESETDSYIVEVVEELKENVLSQCRDAKAAALADPVSFINKHFGALE